jgi:hypothetical protein
LHGEVFFLLTHPLMGDPIFRKLLGQSDRLAQVVNESIDQVMLRLTGVDITRCPHCKKGTLIAVARIPKGKGPSAFAILHPP